MTLVSPSGPPSRGSFWAFARLRAGWKRLALFLGIAAPVSIIFFASARFFTINTSLYLGLLWALIIIVLFSVAIGLLRTSYDYHKVRRELRGLHARADSLAAALSAAHEEKRVAHSINLAQIMREINEILGIDYKYCTMLIDNIGTLSRRDIEHEFDKYLLQILTHTSRIFSIYTMEECAACVKVLCGSSAGGGWPSLRWDTDPSRVAHVRTFGRDPTSRYKRSASDKLDGYFYKDNAAFKYIIEDGKGQSYYFENDLKNPSRPYFNNNPSWPDLYNATAVAAVENPDLSSSQQTIGFLCVDNFKGGFDGDSTRHILQSIASILYYSMGLTFLCMNEIGELSDDSDA